MTELYEITPAPVKNTQVVTAFYNLLNGSSGKPSNMTGYKHRLPDSFADRAFVVRETIVIGGRRESGNRHDVIPMQVMGVLRYDVEADPDQYLTDFHAWAFSKTVGQTLSFASGSAPLKIARETKPGGTAAYDAERKFYYMTADYLVVVKP
jgi:hypothetical protein